MCNLDVRIREREGDVFFFFARVCTATASERRTFAAAPTAFEYADRSEVTVLAHTRFFFILQRLVRSRLCGLSTTRTRPAAIAAGVAFCRRGRFEPTPVPDATPPAVARSRRRASTPRPPARSRRSSGRARATRLCRGRRSHRRARRARASRRVFSTRRAMGRGRWRRAPRAGPPADAPSPRSSGARSARARGARRGLSKPPGCASPRRVAAPSWRARAETLRRCGLGVGLFERAA